ncbi:hypothetical protein B296_00033601, partial [Ensete ventricosum]
GGYGTSLAPANLVGKLFTTFDRSIHRMIGAPPAPLPPMPQGSVNDKETYSVAPRVANSQSTMAMSSLVPSASVETMSEWKGDDSKQTRHNRSISEPDFGRSPEQIPGNVKVKLGQSNKFYYDEQLKTWVEEGAEPPAAEPALPPPPTATTFHNGMPDYNISNTFKSVTNINDAFKWESLTDREGPVAKPLVPLEQKSTIPPTPPSQNQFSARVPSMKPLVGAKFFVPTAPAAVDEGETDAAGESNQEVTNDNEEPSKSATAEASFSSQALSSSSSSMQRVPSMDNITPLGNKGSAAAASWSGNGGPLSRMRAASWSGTYANSLHQNVTGMNPASVGHGMTTSLPSNTAHPGSVSSLSLQQNGGSLGDDLHEVEL